MLALAAGVAAWVLIVDGAALLLWLKVPATVDWASGVTFEVHEFFGPVHRILGPTLTPILIYIGVPAGLGYAIMGLDKLADWLTERLKDLP